MACHDQVTRLYRNDAVMEEDMKLDVGKYYKTRDGRKVLLESVCDDGVRCVILVGSTLHKVWNDHLISEWTDTPEIGTLAEIGAQVGDVVELVSVWEDPLHPNLNTIWEIDECGDAMNHDLGTCFRENDEDYFRKFRIISRAKPQGPVITETVKRIVPGVYGKVSVGFDGPNGDLLVDVTQGLTSADLIAARDVFNQLIDALPEE